MYSIILIDFQLHPASKKNMLAIFNPCEVSSKMKIG